MVKKKGLLRVSALPFHQMDVFQISVAAKLASPSQMWFYDLQLVLCWWHACVNLCRLKHFWAPLPWFVEDLAVLLSLFFFLCVFVPFRAPVVKMQPAALALAVLSVFSSLDCLCAHRSKPNHTQHQNDETGPKQRNQPHIIFILTDDQVCVTESGRVCFLKSGWWQQSTAIKLYILQDANLTLRPLFI